ncbi:apolipoprotein L1 [Denticeps clupeoides]|uniref:Apolipoprotein L, 1 n=1 Tax=Denticeps clupeoides TaxID=299321 RepID=A0AAY4C1R2_9TELE|nr:apolipoprotein L6-like [Denticeps clupeoides]
MTRRRRAESFNTTSRRQLLSFSAPGSLQDSEMDRTGWYDALDLECEDPCKVEKRGRLGGMLKSSHQQDSNMTEQDMTDGAKTPIIPPRPSEEEINSARHRHPWDPQTSVIQLKLIEKADHQDAQSVKMKAVVSQELLPKASAQIETSNEASGSSALEQMKKGKATKPKNPFLSHVAVKRNVQTKPISEQLAALSETAGPEEKEDEDALMEWWNTVERWQDVPQNDTMTEKEEAKAFAVTAEKVQKGIRVFHRLFSEHAEGLWQHVINLHTIADGLDRFNRRTKIAQITGGSTSAVGGVATIAGLALAPVTMGTSLIVTAVGLGVATAGGLTSASAGISNQVNSSLDRKKVERIVEDYQEKMADINKCLKFIKQGIENLRKFDLVKMKKHAYNHDFPGLNNIYEDGAMAGKAILLSANEIMRVMQITHVAGSTAARAVQVASTATGVLTGLFVALDLYFVAKDSQELQKGAKSEFAAKIREVADQLHEGLVELNSIREELRSAGQNPDAIKKLRGDCKPWTS